MRLWRPGGLSKIELALELLRYARHHLHSRPEYVLCDAWYPSRRFLKRLRDYGWYFVCRLKKNRRFKEAKGYWGGRSRLWRTVSETLVRAHAFATAHRKLKKRDFRAQWIVRISAACEIRGIPYSQFIDGLKKAGIELNRKQLAEIALNDAGAFDQLVEAAKDARQAAAVA